MSSGTAQQHGGSQPPSASLLHVLDLQNIVHWYEEPVSTNQTSDMLRCSNNVACRQGMSCI